MKIAAIMVHIWIGGSLDHEQCSKSEPFFIGMPKTIQKPNVLGIRASSV